MTREVPNNINCQLEFDHQWDRNWNESDIVGIDLFAGAGGFSLGLEQAGVKIAACVEIDRTACETLRRNQPGYHSGARIIQRDICGIDGDDLLSMAGVPKGRLDILFGGPPCQGFTTINTSRSVGDPRSQLMFQFIRLVRETQPKIFIIENVPGLLSFRDFFVMILRQLEACGYYVRFNMLQCANYGVPQNRIRVLIEGTRNDVPFRPSFPRATHADTEWDEKHKESLPRSVISHWMFKTEGFSIDDAPHVHWNKCLQILCNRKTETDDFQSAVFASMANRLMEYEKSA